MMKRALLFGLLIVGLLCLTGSVLAQTNPEVLVWSLVGGDISTLNPALITDGNSFTVAGALFSGLFRVDPNTAQPLPDLATWEISDDGLVYTFTLKEGLVWTDGEPITSRDVEFTYKAILSDAVQSPRKADVSTISALEIIDDRTFTVTFGEVNCTVWGTAIANLSPLPRHKFAADYSDFMTNPFNTAPDATSGPYKFVERSPGEFVRLEANPSYYEGVPNIPGLVFRIVADPATLNQALQTSTVDYGFMYPDQLEQLPDLSLFNTFLFPNNNTPMVVMNLQDSSNPQAAYDADGNPVELVPNRFFGDVRVRRAIAMGYDKSALALTLGTNSGSELLTGPITPAFYDAYDMSSVKPWTYDPEAAAALLAEAGWVDTNGDGVLDKDGVPFEVELVYSPLVDLWSNIATVMQDQLGQLGIRINIKSMEWSAYLSEVLLPAKFDLSVVGFGGGTEIDGIAYNLLHSKNVAPNVAFNLASYVNPEMDALLDKARSMPGCSVEDRADLYRQIQQIARDDVPYDWTVSTTAVNVFNIRVTNVEYGQWDGGGIPHNVIGWGLSN